MKIWPIKTCWVVDILVNISYVSGKLESMQSCNLSSQCHNLKIKKKKTSCTIQTPRNTRNSCMKWKEFTHNQSFPMPPKKAKAWIDCRALKDFCSRHTWSDCCPVNSAHSAVQAAAESASLQAAIFQYDAGMWHFLSVIHRKGRKVCCIHQSWEKPRLSLLRPLITSLTHSHSWVHQHPSAEVPTSLCCLLPQ